MTAYFPRRRTPDDALAGDGAREAQRRGGATAILARRSSARSIVFPTIVPAKPRTIVSTSGSSGILYRRRHAAQVELDARDDAVLRGFAGAQAR